MPPRPGCHCHAPRPSRLSLGTIVVQPKNSSHVLESLQLSANPRPSTCQDPWASAEPLRTEHKCCAEHQVQLELVHTFLPGDKALWAAIEKTEWNNCYPLSAAAFQRLAFRACLIAAKMVR